MKTFIKTTAVLIACLIGTVSCSDFLKEEANGKLSSDKSFSLPDDAITCVNALMHRATRAYFGLDQMVWAMWGDDLYTHQASNKGPMREWDMYTISTNNERMLRCWQYHYRAIKAANYIIDGVESTPDAKQEDIDYALGQAYFWRALSYFHLVRVFGPLPMSLHLGVDFDADLTTVAGVYEQIIADLKIAEEKLLPDYSDAPKKINGSLRVASRAAVQAVLSNVYLTMAGWPLEYGTEYYTLAAAEALKVINGCNDGTYKFSLYDEYWKIYSKQENEANKEAICVLYYSRAFGTGDNDVDAGRGGINETPGGDTGGWSDTAAEIQFWVDFEGKARKEATYAAYTVTGANANAEGVYPHVRWWKVADENFKHPYFTKAQLTLDGKGEYDCTLPWGVQANDWDSKNHQIVRLGEVYCWYAEAIGRSGTGDKAKAIELLNIIRRRADGEGAVNNYYPADMSYQALGEAAFKEHGWEIAGYMWGSLAPRAADMQRMKMFQTHFEKRKANRPIIFNDPDTGAPVTVHETYAPTGNWSESSMFAPYPSDEVDMNPKLISNEEKLKLIK